MVHSQQNIVKTKSHKVEKNPEHVENIYLVSFGDSKYEEAFITGNI